MLFRESALHWLVGKSQLSSPQPALPWPWGLLLRADCSPIQPQGDPVQPQGDPVLPSPPSFTAFDGFLCFSPPTSPFHVPSPGPSSVATPLGSGLGALPEGRSVGCHAGLEQDEATSACAECLDTRREQPAPSPKEPGHFFPACKKLSGCPLVAPCLSAPIRTAAGSYPVPGTKGLFNLAVKDRPRASSWKQKLQELYL